MGLLDNNQHNLEIWIILAKLATRFKDKETLVKSMKIDILKEDDGRMKGLMKEFVEEAYTDWTTVQFMEFALKLNGDDKNGSLRSYSDMLGKNLRSLLKRLSILVEEYIEVSGFSNANFCLSLLARFYTIDYELTGKEESYQRALDCYTLAQRVTENLVAYDPLRLEIIVSLGKFLFRCEKFEEASNWALNIYDSVYVQLMDAFDQNLITSESFDSSSTLLNELLDLRLSTLDFLLYGDILFLPANHIHRLKCALRIAKTCLRHNMKSAALEAINEAWKGGRQVIPGENIPANVLAERKSILSEMYSLRLTLLKDAYAI